MNKGIITGFQGSFFSGIAALIVKDENGIIREVPCENAATVRALDACYGGVIGPGHTVVQRSFVGKKIFYECSDWGTLGRFVPACDMCCENPAIDALDGKYVCEKCIQGLQRRFDES